MEDPPNPGTIEAQSAGCTCPVIDNGHGHGSGFYGPDGKPEFWITEGCPLHCSASVPTKGN